MIIAASNSPGAFKKFKYPNLPVSKRLQGASVQRVCCSLLTDPAFGNGTVPVAPASINPVYWECAARYATPDRLALGTASYKKWKRLLLACIVRRCVTLHGEGQLCLHFDVAVYAVSRQVLTFSTHADDYQISPVAEVYSLQRGLHPNLGGASGVWVASTPNTKLCSWSRVVRELRTP